MVDSFVVERLTMGYNDEDDHEEILIFLKSPDNTFYRSFGIFLYPDWIAVTYNHYHSIGFSADEPTQIFEINGVNYNNVYIVEQESDTLIDKILFQGENGILGYRFVDGDEYYLDTIINPE